MNTGVSMKDLIQRYVHLYPPNSKGWYPCVHQGCDHGKKGPRAAFIFDGENVGFHCFNCPTKPKFNPYDPELSEDFIQLLRDFCIPDEAWQAVLFNSLKNKDSGNKKSASKVASVLDIEPQELKLPSSFYKLSEADESDKWAIIAYDYLEFERGIAPSSYPFYLSEKTEDKFLSKWHKRLIIPMYKEGKLIFYQGRRLIETMSKKYESPSAEGSKVFGCFDNLLKKTQNPILIVEGWFDAFVIDGVAVIGNTISKEQILWLNRSPRRKIYIPDKSGKGHLAAQQALRNGWDVSLPDFTDCKDTSDAVKRFGKLYVVKSIVDQACNGFEAELQIQFIK